MTLTDKEKAVLRALVEKEIEDMGKEKLFISNSPFLNKVIRDDPDVPFLKSEALYQEFLQELLKKL